MPVIWLCAYFLLNTALWSEADLSILPAAALMFPLSRSLSGISVVSFRAAKNSGLLRTFQDGAQRRRGAHRPDPLGSSMRRGDDLALPPYRAVSPLQRRSLYFCIISASAGKRFGGTTGDLAGYFLQVCELAMLAVSDSCGRVFMEVIFIRHFATPGNEKRQYIGRTDEPLSARAVNCLPGTAGRTGGQSFIPSSNA